MNIKLTIKITTQLNFLYSASLKVTAAGFFIYVDSCLLNYMVSADHSKLEPKCDTYRITCFFANIPTDWKFCIDHFVQAVIYV